MKNKTRVIKFAVYGFRWFDRVNGNTYHSVKIVRIDDGAELFVPFTYGYDDHYQQSALEKLVEKKWLPKQYTKETAHLYDRENNYPIIYNVIDGLKRDCIRNGEGVDYDTTK